MEIITKSSTILAKLNPGDRFISDVNTNIHMVMDKFIEDMLKPIKGYTNDVRPAINVKTAEIIAFRSDLTVYPYPNVVKTVLMSHISPGDCFKVTDDLTTVYLYGGTTFQGVTRVYLYTNLKTGEQSLRYTDKSVFPVNGKVVIEEDK